MAHWYRMKKECIANMTQSAVLYIHRHWNKLNQGNHPLELILLAQSTTGSEGTHGVPFIPSIYFPPSQVKDH